MGIASQALGSSTQWGARQDFNNDAPSAEAYRPWLPRAATNLVHSLSSS